MNNRPPMVSVCLLTYNRAGVLEGSVQDLLCQSFRDFEFIINDNHSTDNTEAVCQDIVSRFPDVRYYRNERNVGYGGNQNAAVERSTGKYVAFVHDGDRYSPQLLERWVDALERHPSAALVFNAINTLDADHRLTGGFDHGYPPLVRGLDLYDEMLRSLSSPIFGIVMVRRTALSAAGRFDDSMRTLADVDMWFRLLRQNDAAYVQDRLYSTHPREHDHPASRVNWQLRNELARIYRIACDRRHVPMGREWQRCRRRVDLNLARASLLDLAICLTKKQWRVFAQGLPETARYVAELVQPRLETCRGLPPDS